MRSIQEVAGAGLGGLFVVGLRLGSGARIGCLVPLLGLVGGIILGELPGDSSMHPWEKLREDLRESNRQQADDIAAKLRRIDCAMLPVADRGPRPFTFTDEEVEIMAEMEHARWIRERRLAGWVYGPERDPDHKITPYLVRYAELPSEPEDVKEWDREAVRAIPELLAQAKFEVHRLGGVAVQAGNESE
jgi:hypothetical protein